MKAVERALSDALGRVGKLYEQHAEPRPDVNGADWVFLEAEIEQAIATANQSRALAAIAAWERHAKEALRV